MASTAERYNTFDPSSIEEMASLLGGHRQAALATIDADGGPYLAMVGYALEPAEGAFLVLLSDLSLHKGHIRADPRVSLLVVEPDDGHGEVMQKRRVSLRCTAQVLERGSDAYGGARALYLENFPPHLTMFGLGDFDLVRLVVQDGLFNAGFGRAYKVRQQDFAAATRRNPIF